MGRRSVPTFFLLTLACFLNFAAAFSGEIQLGLNAANDENLPCPVEIKISEPVHCVWFYTDNPPSLTIDFIEEGLYCSFEKEIILHNGPIKKIKTFCSDKGYADFLVLELNQPSTIAAAANGFLTIKIGEILPGVDGVSSQRQSEVEAAIFLARGKIEQRKSPNTAKGYNVNKIIAAPLLENPVGSLSAEKFPAAENIIDEGQFSEEEVLQEAASHAIGNSHKTRNNVSFFENDVWQESGGLLKEKELHHDRSGSENNVPVGNILEAEGNAEFFNSAFCTSFSERHSFLVGMVYLLGFILMAALMIFSRSAAGNNRIETMGCRRRRKRGEDEIFVEKMRSGQIANPGCPTDIEILGLVEDRRRYARIKIEDLKPRPDFKIETVNRGNKKYKYRLKDLSLEGAGFELLSELDTPLIIQIGISLPGWQPMEICARIIWHHFAGEGKKHYGVQFLTVSEVDRQRLETYLYKNQKSH